jgi:hypothetical protein
MSTARVIHHDDEENLSPQPIAISSSGVVSPQTCIIANGQSVAFSSAGPTVTVTFEPDAIPGWVVFNNVTVSPSSPQTIAPRVNDRTVNFNIDGSNVYPYAIQVGAGPMYVAVSYNSVLGVVTCTPGEVVIPYGSSSIQRGTLTLVPSPSQPNNTYSVAWPQGDPFNPQINNVPQSGNLPMARSAGSNYNYTVAYTGIAGNAGSGGGKVIVRGS